MKLVEATAAVAVTPDNDARQTSKTAERSRRQKIGDCLCECHGFQVPVVHKLKKWNQEYCIIVTWVDLNGPCGPQAVFNNILQYFWRVACGAYLVNPE